MVQDTTKKDFYSYSLGSSQAIKKLHRFQAGMRIINTIYFFTSQPGFDFPLILFSFGLPKT